MNVKSVSNLRRWIKIQLAGDFDKNTDADFIGSYYGDPVKGKKGFFKIFHGIKPDIAGYLPSILKIAEDGQAIYEFIQNAVDCNSSHFWIYYDERFLIALNNGEPFRQNEIASILNVSQSDKRTLPDAQRCDKIGRFGIGFKLVHRLLGENDGTSELTNVNNGGYSGPIIFSWNQYRQFKTFLNFKENIQQVKYDKNNPSLYNDAPWLFKILLTNFPAAPQEIVKDLNYSPLNAFALEEVDEIRNFIKDKFPDSELENPTLLRRGSLFFLRLGNNKYTHLKEEGQEIENGVQYTLNILKKLQKVTINDVIITKKKIELRNYEIDQASAEFIKINPEYNFCPIKISVGYHTEIEKTLLLKSSPNFFKYFPLGDEVDQLGVIIHSDAFDIEANRRKLHKSERNIFLLRTIKDRLIDEMAIFCKHDKQSYVPIFISILLSDYKKDDKVKWITENFTNYLFEFISNKVPTASNRLLSKENVIIKAFNFDIQLQELGFPQKDWFKWINENNSEIIKNAELKEKLALSKWYLRNLIVQAPTLELNTYLKGILDNKYESFIGELNKEEFTSELKLKLTEVSWIRSNSGGMFKLSQLKNGELWVTNSLDENLLRIFKLLGKEVVNNAVCLIASRLPEIQSNFFTEPQAILEFIKTEEGSRKLIELPDSDRYELIQYLSNFKEFTPQIRELPFIKNKSGSLSAPKFLINDSNLILGVEFNLIVAATNERDLLKSYKFESMLVSEDSISVELHNNRPLAEKLKSSITKDDLKNFYLSLIEIHKKRNPKLTDNGLTGVFSAVINEDASIKWVSNNEIYHLPGFNSLSFSEYTDLSIFMLKYAQTEIIHHHGLPYLAQLSRTPSSSRLSEKIMDNSTIPLDQFEGFMELSNKIGVNKVFEDIYILQTGNEVRIKKKTADIRVFNYYSDTLEAIEIDVDEIRFIPFYSKIAWTILDKHGLLKESDFGYYLVKFANNLTVDQNRFVSKSDIKTKLEYLKKVGRVEFIIEKELSGDDSIVQLIYLLNELAVYASRNKDIKEHSLLANEIEEALMKFRESAILKGKSLKQCNYQTEILVKSASKTEYKFSINDLAIGNRENIGLFKEFRQTLVSIEEDVFSRVFKPHRWNVRTEIFDNLLQSKVSPSICQGVFLIIYASVNNVNLDTTIFRQFDTFSTDEKVELFNYVYSEDRRSFEPFNKWPNLSSNLGKGSILTDSSLALDFEIAKPWLNDWIGTDQEKYKFLEEFGLYCSDKSIVPMRKKIKVGMMGDDESLKLLQDSSDQNRLYWTVQWMASLGIIPVTETGISFTKSLINKTYGHFKKYSEDVAILSVDLVSKTYAWVNRNPELKIYRVKNLNEDNHIHVANYLSTKMAYIVDDTISETLDDNLGINDVELQLKIDRDWIIANSTELTNPQEVQWALTNQLQIRELPNDGALYHLFFENDIICDVFLKDPKNEDSIIYFVRTTNAPLPFLIEMFLTDQQKVNFFRPDENKPEEEDKDSYKSVLTKEEVIELEQLLQRKLNDGEMENIWIVGLFRALKQYELEGHDVTYCKQDLESAIRKKMLENIIDVHSGETKRVLVRSARKGLLYMRFNVWIDLLEPTTELFVVTGTRPGEHRIFKSQEEIANNSEDDWVARLPATNKLEELTSLINGEYQIVDKKFSHLYFYVRIKNSGEYRSIFEDIYKSELSGDFNNLD